MKKKITDLYTYRIIWSADDQQFVGLCTEFSSLSWLADSPEDALGGIRKMVTKSLRDLKEGGETPPEPLGNRRFSGKLVIRIPPETHRSLAMQASESGISLNRLIASKLQ